MKQIIFLLLFLTGIFANTNVIVPTVPNNSIITDQLIINYKRPINVKDLHTIKYSKDDLVKDVENSCSIPTYKKDIKDKTVLDIFTNKDLTQLAIIHYVSCSNLNKNDYIIVNNNKVETGKTIIAYYKIVDNLKREIVSSKQILQKTLKNICSKKSFRNFLNKDKNVAIMIYTNQDRTAFSIYLFNHCPIQ